MAVCKSTGFMHTFRLDDGLLTASECADKPWKFVGEVVLSFASKFKATPYVWWFFDNYFTNAPLMKRLYTLYRHHSTGTWNMHRKDAPAMCKLESVRPTKKCPKGHLSFCHSSDRIIMCWGWMDSSACYFADTMLGGSVGKTSRRRGVHHLWHTTRLPHVSQLINQE